MNSINWPASSIWVFKAQLGEHCSANAEATGSNPVEAPKNFFGGYFRNCLTCDSLRWSHTHFICIPAVHIISFKLNSKSTAHSSGVFGNSNVYILDFGNSKIYPPYQMKPGFANTFISNWFFAQSGGHSFQYMTRNWWLSLCADSLQTMLSGCWTRNILYIMKKKPLSRRFPVDV